MRLTLFDLAIAFSSPHVHPARKGLTRRRRKIGRQVSGNSKWHRRMLAAGLKRRRAQPPAPATTT